MSSDYFLGCNSANGFYSLFGELYDPYDGWTLYIIKGGPGTGKSTLMKKLCKKADEKNIKYEKIHCSSDPESLDGVIFNDLKLSIADGTSPHVLEPKFPGAIEQTITLNNYWNKDILKENRDNIIKYTTLISAEHKKCIQYLKAAKIIQNEIDREVILNSDVEKIKRFIIREIKKNNDYIINKETPAIKNRLIDALTPEGIILYKNTIYDNTKNIIKFKDKYCVISPIIINELSNYYISHNMSLIKCESFLSPSDTTKHLILPQTKKAYITDDYENNCIESGNNSIHVSRFYSKTIKTDIETLNSALKAKISAINEAGEHLKKAKELHDKLEEYYINAMNFEELNKYCDRIINEIL